MLTKDLSATKTYRTLARGSGCSWSARYGRSRRANGASQSMRDQAEAGAHRRPAFGEPRRPWSR